MSKARLRARAGRSRARRLAPGAVGAAGVLLLAFALIAEPAWALEVGGAMGWNLARTESNSEVADSVQESFGQTYRVNLGGAVLRRRLAIWSGGVGWRRDLTTFSGIDLPSRQVKVTDFDFGLRALPATLPINLNLHRSKYETGAGELDTNVITTTASLTTDVPMPDGHPLGFSAYESIQDAGTGAAKAKLVGLRKRFDLTGDTDLSSAYQFSRYTAPAGDSTGHAVSLSSHTRWNPRLTSNLFGNVSSRSSSTTREAGGRSLFLNNSAGGSLRYMRGRVASGNLSYSYTQSPQDRAEDVRSHQLSANGRLRVDTKTDVSGRFVARRLDLPTATLDTASASVNLIHRPRFGWSTGGSLGTALNQTSGVASSDRATYTASGFLNARHDLVPAQVDWGGNVSYASTTGDFAQDRLTTILHAGATDRVLQTQRVTAVYRFSDIREDHGFGLDPFMQDHGITVTDNVVPIRGILLPADLISGSLSGAVHWSQQYRPDRSIRTTSLDANAKYLPFPGLVTSAAFELRDNSSNLGGADETLRGLVSYTHRTYQSGSARLSGQVKRTWAGGNYESQEWGGTFDYDYAIGLLHITFTADASFVDLGRGAQGTDTTGVRLNIVRTF